jgi:hypothetical protein
MLRLLRGHHITHYITLLHFYFVKQCVMLVSASRTDKKKNGSLNLLSIVIYFLFLRTCASAKILFSHGMHGSIL